MKELLVKVNGTWQSKGFSPKEEMGIRAAKWKELGFRTRLRAA